MRCLDQDFMKTKLTLYSLLGEDFAVFIVAKVGESMCQQLSHIERIHLAVRAWKDEYAFKVLEMSEEVGEDVG